MTESGYRDMEADSWVGVLVPAKTPKETVAMLNRAIVNIVAAPEMQKHLAALGYDAVGSTAEDFAARIKADTEKWANVIRAANIKSD